MTTTKKETDMETPIVSDNQDEVRKQELEENKAKENPLPKKGVPAPRRGRAILAPLTEPC